MMSDPHPGASPEARARASALAGRLAELGETRLTLLQPGQPPRPLTPRQTDLPATILAAMASGGATLFAETLGIHITIPPGPRGTGVPPVS